MKETKYLEGLVDRSFLNDPEKRAKMEETREVPFIISSNARDRHKSRVNMNNWKLDNYNMNPIVGYQHNVYGDNMCVPPNPDDVLGSSRVYFEERDGRTLMIGVVRFDNPDVNPLAEKICQKVLSGTLRAASVGFLEVGEGRTVKEKDAGGKVIGETYEFDGQELLEWSIVNIPSNPEATTKSLRNHTIAGIGFLRGIGMTIPEIRKIANDILDAIEAKEQPEQKTIGADPNLNKYQEQLRKFKK
jgi:hypothetical protein